ncbi:M20 family metallopeptidase [Oceanobacillus salinisoli]|uniref:M20 family metallopeptidase n=1 Tax=Oceanobacillus salinisoli TaxID=2678611 RepID=UPI0012E31ADF|nr:M20 family metallopeptidase [Oceanobacillus salinisoli]
MHAEIKEYLSHNKYRQILKSLVQTNTTNLPGNEMDVVNAILDFFPREKITYNVIDHGENRGSLVITIPGVQQDRSLAFVGHIDTVPVSDAEDWNYPPFDAVVDENGFLHGRGSADMKGGVTAMIVTALYFIEKEITPQKTLKFCFTADEESGGIGAISLREQGYLDDVEAMIIPEPTKEGIGISEKGALWLNVQATGKAAHGSRPDLGINAVEEVTLFLEKLKQTINTSYDDPLLGKTTCSITQFKGGVKTNIIPNQAMATMDIRTTPDQDHERIIGSANEIAREQMNNKPGLTINLEIENNRPPVSTNKSETFVLEMQQVYRELSYDSTVKGLQFYTDASQLIPYLNIPFVILGPGKEEMAHQTNECIELSSVEKVAEIYLSYLLRGEKTSD